MAEFPALPLWTDAYLGDTTHLTAVEHGAYLLLLITAWRSQGTKLPDDDKRLARFARLTGSQWARIKPTIAEFFVVENGFWMQRRLTDEANAVRQLRERQAEKGRKSGQARSLKTKARHAAPVQSGSPAVPTEPEPNMNLPYSIYVEDKPSTGADAPADPVKLIFDLGVQLLTAAGRTTRDARSIIGRWRKGQGDAWVLEALLAARQGAVTDPVPWIEARRKGDVGEDLSAQRAELRRQYIADLKREDAEKGMPH